MTKPTYSDFEGTRYTTDQIERRIKKAALELLDMQFLELGYNVCTKCHRNDCKPLDISHNISRKKAKEMGRVELLWDYDNMEIIGRRHHKVKDGLNLQFT